MRGESVLIFINFLQYYRSLDFISWKEEHQSEHSVSFVRTRGKHRSVNGSYVEYYTCHRSYSPNITSGKRTKFVGSRKTGICCPARIKLLVKEGETIAYFTNTHVGHTCDPGKTSLNLTEKQNIAREYFPTL